ncbi:endolytic transglycosylase MltG, partial [Escherichia coli]|nr:endolytic transglycosylase MltG [Escherichia coli]
GETRTIKFTIPEGFTRFDLAKRIKERLPAEERSEDEIVALFNDTSAISDIAPEAKNLEGYLYPSTYELNPLAKTEDLI